MLGKIFITSTGYDPQLGKHIKDPFLGDPPTLGACRPDIRRVISPGDHLFVISGKVRGAEQFVLGGFEVDRKISALEAYIRFPKQRLRSLPDGQLDGNVVVDSKGNQHRLDTHDGDPGKFGRRIENYLIGKNGIALTSVGEIARAREQTLPVLRQILKKGGASAKELVGRWGCELSEEQVLELRDWLNSIRDSR